MKKNSSRVRAPHVLSSIARSATMLGSCLVVSNTIHANEMFLDDTKFGEGTGGGSTTTPLVSGGTHAVTITAVSGLRFAVTLTVTCTGATDYVSCLGTIFNNTGVLTTYTTQGACTANTYVNTFTAATSSGCTAGTAYNLNFFCDNQTTHTNTNYSSGATAAFTCAA